MARAEGELRNANKALDEVAKEANTVIQQRNTMHTVKRTGDKKLRDAKVSEWGEALRVGGMVKLRGEGEGRSGIL